MTTEPMTAERIAKLASGHLAAGKSQAAVLYALESARLACDPPMMPLRLADIIGEQAAAQARARRVGIVAPPLETPTHSGRRYAWAPEGDAPGVTVTIERIEQTRSALLAEIAIDAGDVRLHGPVITSLTSTQNQEGLTRYLDKLYPMRGWHDVVGVAFRLAVEAHRTGEPPMRLADPVPPGAGGYALEPIIVEDDPTMIYAKGGSGKSWLALAIAAALDGAGGVLPFRLIAPHRVAYLDWEWTRGRHAKRLGMMLAPDQLEACGILYRRMAGGLAGQVDQLARMIADHGITYLVIDSLGMACGDDPEKASTALPFANAVRALGVGSLWVTHTPKNGDQEMPFGSAYWLNAARSAWQVQCNSEPGASTMRLALHQRKVNDGPPEEPISLALKFEGGRLAITRTDIYHEPDFQDAIPPRARIMRTLRQGKATVAEIAKATGVEGKAVETELRKLEQQNRVVNFAGGEWGAVDLTAPRAPTPPLTNSEPIPW